MDAYCMLSGLAILESKNAACGDRTRDLPLRYQICLEHNTDEYVKAGTYMVMEKLLVRRCYIERVDIMHLFQLVLYRNLAKRVYSIVDPASCAYKLDLEYFEIGTSISSITGPHWC